MFNGYRLQVDDLLDLVFEPSCYQSYLRKIFQTAYSEGRLCISSFISSQGIEKLKRRLNFLRKDVESFGRKPCAEPNRVVEKKPKSMKKYKSASAEQHQSMKNKDPHSPEETQPRKKKKPSSPKQPRPMQSLEQVETINRFDVLIEDLDEDLSEDRRTPNIDCPNLYSNLSRDYIDPLNNENETKHAETNESTDDLDKRNEEHCDQKGETLSRDSMIVSTNFVGTIQMNFQNCDDKGRRNPVVDKDGYQWKNTTNKSRKTVYKCSALQQ